LTRLEETIQTIIEPADEPILEDYVAMARIDRDLTFEMQTTQIEMLKEQKRTLEQALKTKDAEIAALVHLHFSS